MSAIGSALLLAATWSGHGETFVESIEFNTFGPTGSERTAIIFRDADGEIVDWRWFEEGREPVQIGPQRWRMMWREGKRLLNLVARRVVSTRTLDDRELSERSHLPEHRRRKLR